MDFYTPFCGLCCRTLSFVALVLYAENVNIQPYYLFHTIFCLNVFAVVYFQKGEVTVCYYKKHFWTKALSYILCIATPPENAEI